MSAKLVLKCNKSDSGHSMPKGPPLVTHQKKDYLQNADINLQMFAW